ncbi:O-antigen ligase family protein [Hymenobacter sp. B81]|uniref:O-antigen ligase family protein n=1 Tax=Hymenobacter sp. B81 TaxID=3344878 RepID=UPI0037DC632B
MSLLIFTASSVPPWWSVERVQLAASISCGLIITGLFTVPFFRALSSIGLAALALTGIGYAVVYRQIGQQQKWPVYAALALVFALHLLTGLNTEAAHAKLFWTDVVLQLPFLLLPLAFWLLPPLPTAHLRRLYGLLLALTVCSALGSTGYYLLHAREINELYTHSQVMPTVPDHIRFSLLVALSIVVGAVLLEQGCLAGRARQLVLVATAFLVGYLHLLAVRSGLMAFYALASVGLLVVLRRRDWPRVLRLGLLLIMLPVLSYWLLPTFYNKYHNTREDAGKVEHTRSANNYSLVGRVYSYQAALHIVRDHPLIGVGKADMEAEMAARYRRYFPQIGAESYIKPHNQFLYYLAAFGGVGLLAWLLCFYFPLWWVRCQPAPLLRAQYLIVTLSFLVEPTLETQTGITFGLFFLLLPLSSLPPQTAATNGPGGAWRPV